MNKIHKMKDFHNVKMNLTAEISCNSLVSK